MIYFKIKEGDVKFNKRQKRLFNKDYCVQEDKDIYFMSGFMLHNKRHAAFYDHDKSTNLFYLDGKCMYTSSTHNNKQWRRFVRFSAFA